MTETKLLNTEEMAAQLGIHAKTLLTWVSEDKIPHIRLGPKTIRFEPDRVLDAIRTNAEGK